MAKLIPPLAPEDGPKVATVMLGQYTNDTIGGMLDGLDPDIQAEYGAKYGPGWKPFLTMHVQMHHKPVSS
jgi:hypothetical protein